MSSSNLTPTTAAGNSSLTNSGESQTEKRKPRKTRRNQQQDKLLQHLNLPFDPALIRWKAFQTDRRSRILYGLCLPYADPRAYKDRLNELFGTDGWKNDYQITTLPSKIVVNCRLEIERLGSHSATGEEWTRNENARTSAEAQAFKRACSCFGLGRYLYDVRGVWLELDEQRRILQPPPLPDWATPEGWQRGLRAPLEIAPEEYPPVTPNSSGIHDRLERLDSHSKLKNVVAEITSMRRTIGPKLYRSILKNMAHAWQPSDIRKIDLQHKVLNIMQSAARGLTRLRLASDQAGEAKTRQMMRAMNLNSPQEIKDMDELEQVVLALERLVNDLPKSQPN